LEESEDILQARVTKAMAGLYEKLMKPLEHFADKMGDAECIFRDTTVSNLKDIVAMLPELNFADDPNLTRLGEKIAKSLVPYTAKDLRDKPIVRAAVASEACEILESMRGYMNCFAGSPDDGV
jgi:hypothetical protein